MIRALKYWNFISFILMICINALANTMPIGIGNTGEISNKYPNLYTPAPITFSIWGIIYLLVAFFIAYQFGILDSAQFSESFVNLIGPWFIISCIMNIGWIFSWHYDITWLSMVFILGLLTSLIFITSKLSTNAIVLATNTDSVPIFAKVCIFAFDIYLGWIVAATIANMSALLVRINWNRFGLSEEFWTVSILIAGTLIGMMFIFISQKYMSSLAIIWAFSGILIKHISQKGYAGTYPAIIATTIIGISIILASGIIQIAMHKSS